jgi:branched-chain amino acid transport system permease protein
VNRSELTRRAVKAGLIGGVAVIYLAMVGMVEKFDARHLIGEPVTLGRLLLALPPLLGAYLAVRPSLRSGRVEQVPQPQALLTGVGSGLVVGALVAVAIAVNDAFPPGAVRSIFVAVSPELESIMTFGRSLPVAALLLLLGGASLGGLGAAYRAVPLTYRRPVTIGLVVTFLLGLLQRIVPQMLFQLGLATHWLYSTAFGGLTPFGALVVFTVTAGAMALWSLKGAESRQRVAELPPLRRRAVVGAGLLAAVAVLAVLPVLLGSSLSQVLGSVGIYVLMGLGLNIVVGYAGLLDLGYVAFFAVGAYATALFTGANTVSSLGATVAPAFSMHLNFYAAIPVVILIAAFVGLLIGAPVLRLRGDYLAIVTLGFGEIARVLVTSDWLQRFLGGAQGLRDVTDAAIGSVSFRNPQPFYYLVLVFCVLAVYVSGRLADSRVGRAWNAMREDELAAEAMGVSVVRYKLLAFALGASVGCLSGALFAVQLGSLTPTSFNILVSITALSVVILGGMGSIPGVIVGALVLIGIPGFLSEFEEFRLLIYGAVLIAIMVLRPQGLIPNVRRMSELREEDLEQDQWLHRGEEAAAPIVVGGGTGDAP